MLPTGTQAKRKTVVEAFAQDRQVLQIGDYQALVDQTLLALSDQSFARRLWEKDPSLWRQGPVAEKAIRKRLDWLDVVDLMAGRVEDITQFVEEVKSAGFTDVVLLGMGGSSLSAQASLATFHIQDGFQNFKVLDSTIPGRVLEIEREIDIRKTLFIVASKSGKTVETLSAYRYFFEKVKARKGKHPGDNFIAITDPGTPLESEGRNHHFRRIFLNFPDIGGRYSVLSYFGLVPAAMIGADIHRMLDRASQMIENCAADVDLSENPGIALGVAIGELAVRGRNKITFISSQEIAGFCDWLEQLIAESTGKQGTGLIPVVHEPLVHPDCYGDDRQFIYLRLADSDWRELDDAVLALESAGQPLVRIHLDDVYDLGQEYFRWEVATATVGALLGIDAFDEPNVEESKDNTNRLLGEYLRAGRFEDQIVAAEEDGITLYCDRETKITLDRIKANGKYSDHSLLSYIDAHLTCYQPGGYYVLMAFLQPSSEIEHAISCLRARVGGRAQGGDHIRLWPKITPFHRAVAQRWAEFRSVHPVDRR